MSHLTSETREVWVPAYYDGGDHSLFDGADYVREEDALSDAVETVANYADTGQYIYAKIEHRIVPVYK